MSQLVFNGGNIYFGGDSATVARKGIFRCAVTDFANPANYVKVGGAGGQVGDCYLNGTEMIGFEADSVSLSYRMIITSKDLVTFNTRQLSVGLSGNYILMIAKGKTTAGWHSVLIQEYPYTVANMLTGRTLMLKLK